MYIQFIYKGHLGGIDSYRCANQILIEFTYLIELKLLMFAITKMKS